MKTQHKSIFNLIEIFGKTGKKIRKTLNISKHCEHKHLHDYYCDSKEYFLN